MFFSVFRKNTSNDSYLRFESNHHLSQKLAVIDTLIHRAILICDECTVDSELLHLSKVLQSNGYPEKLIVRRIHKVIHNINAKVFSKNTVPETSQEERERRLVLPNIGKDTDTLCQKLKNKI